MVKKYSPQPICSYKSYRIPDLCKIYKDQKLHPQTVRDFIKKEGLKAFSHKGDFYIYGAVFKEFLANRNKISKEEGSLGVDNFRCGKCKTKKPPLNHIITKLTNGRNGCLLAFGICIGCGHEIQRPFKKIKRDEIFKIFQVQLDEVPTLYNSSNSTKETHLSITKKTGVSQSSKTKNPLNPQDSLVATNETKQLSIFDFIN